MSTSQQLLKIVHSNVQGNGEANGRPQGIAASYPLQEEKIEARVKHHVFFLFHVTHIPKLKHVVFVYSKFSHFGLEKKFVVTRLTQLKAYMYSVHVYTSLVERATKCLATADS